MSVGARWAVRPLSIALLAGYLAGCKTWQPAPAAPVRYIAEERPERVRVRVSGGSIVTLRHPMIVNDSIVSSTAPAPGALFAPPRPGVVSEDVRSLEVARFSPGRTVGLVAVIAAASVGWAKLAGANAGGSRPGDGKLPKGLDVWGLARLVLGGR